MISMLIATVMLAHAKQEPTTQSAAPAQAPETASGIISKMFEHYSSATSLIGTIKLTQAAQGTAITIETNVEFDKPSKIYLYQVRHSSEPREWLVISDGNKFAYDKPDGVFGQPRFKEWVAENGIHQTYRDIYAAAVRSLGDKSSILDSAIARTADLQHLLGQWASFHIAGKTKVGDKTVTEIDGEYREDLKAAISGQFAMYIDSDYNFDRFVLRQRFAVPDHIDQVVDVTSTWDSDLKVNGTTNPQLYSNVR